MLFCFVLFLPLCSPQSETELKEHGTFCISTWQTSWKTQGNLNNVLYCYTFLELFVFVSNKFSHFLHTSLENDNKEDESEELAEGLSGETGGKPDTSSAVGAALNIKDRDPMDAYKRAAPQLLNELAHLLSQHKWTEKGCIPRGIVNILNYSLQDLTAGAVRWNRPEQTEKPGESKGSLKLDEARPPNDKREAGEINSCFMENVGPSVRKPQVSSNARIKKRKQRGKLICGARCYGGPPLPENENKDEKLKYLKYS